MPFVFYSYCINLLESRAAKRHNLNTLSLSNMGVNISIIPLICGNIRDFQNRMASAIYMYVLCLYAAMFSCRNFQKEKRGITCSTQVDDEYRRRP